MTYQRTESRVFLRIFIGAVALSGLAALGYLLFGDRLVVWAYQVSNHISTSQTPSAQDPAFQEYARQTFFRFWSNIVLGIPLSVLVLFFLYRLYRYLLSITSLPIKPDHGTTSISSGALIASLLYSCFTLACFAPVLPHFSTALIGPPEDNQACYWTLDWAYQNVLHGKASLGFVNDLFYPDGSSFYFHAWSFYNLLLSFLLRGWFSAITTYNLLILHTFPLAGIGGYLLTRYLTKNHWAGLLGGFLFAFNPSHLIRAEHHMNIATIQFIPLFVLFFIKTIRCESRSAVVWCALFFLLNSLVDWNYMLYGIWFIILAYTYLAIKRRRFWLPDMARKSALIVGSTVILLSWWLVPMIRLALMGGMGDGGGHNQYVVDLFFFTPGPLHLFGQFNILEKLRQSFSGWPWETTGYLGIIALVIVGLAWADIKRTITPWLLGGLSLLLALGAQPHLMGINIPALVPGRLIPLIPILSNSRAPSRNMVLVYLFWSVIVSFSAMSLWQHLKRKRLGLLIVAGLLILLVADYFSLCRTDSPVILPACYNSLSSGNERYGVLDLPSGYQAVEQYMLYQRLHGHPIVQGWVSRKLKPSLIDTLEMRDLSAQKAQLLRARVKYIVLHKRFLPDPAINAASYGRAYPTMYDDSLNTVLQVY